MNYGVIVKNVKNNDRGDEKVSWQWWMRYVSEEAARMRYGLKVMEGEYVYLVQMVEPQVASHICSLECACIVSIIEGGRPYQRAPATIH